MVAWTVAASYLALALTAATIPGVPTETISEDDTVLGGGYIYYGAYEPRQPRSLKGFPQDIRTRLATHLRSRLGDAVLARLKYSGGQIVDLDRLYEVQPNARNFQWVVPSYLVIFAIEFGPDPAERYYASISLDAKGDVLNEIDLPRTAVDPLRLSVLPKARALEIAALHGVPIERAEATLAYSPGRDCLEWLVAYTVEERPPEFRMRVLHVCSVGTIDVHWSERMGMY